MYFDLYGVYFAVLYEDVLLVSSFSKYLVFLEFYVDLFSYCFELLFLVISY